MSQIRDAKKLIFDLNVVDDWPPVAAESLWLKATGANFVVKSVPFFIPGIAFDDVVGVTEFDEVRARIDRVVEQSGNSTIWAYFSQAYDCSDVIARLSELGVGVEGGSHTGYFAFNLPITVALSEFNTIMSPIENAGHVEVVYGELRHAA